MPLEMRTYIVKEYFCLNMDNGKNTINVGPGDIIEFDGLYAQVGDVKGQARMLQKVMGSWIEEYDGDIDTLKEAHDEIVSQPQPSPSQMSRNATGGRIIEDSSAEHELRGRDLSHNEYNELKRLVDEYENYRAETKVSSDLQDAHNESKNVRIINQDEDVVAQVSKSAHTDAKSNNAGVIIDKQEQHKRPVIAAEEGVVKETNYGGNKQNRETPRKHLEVDRESEGRVVKKTGTSAKSAKEEKSSNVTKSPQVVAEQVEVAETSYEDAGSTDIGSSTQAHVESGRSAKTRTAEEREAAYQAAKEKARNNSASKNTEKAKKEGPIIISDQQEGKVVGKVKKISGSKTTKEGIISRVTVGPSGEFDPGEASFSGDQGITVGKVQYGSGRDTSNDGVEVDFGEDLNVDDLLGDI